MENSLPNYLNPKTLAQLEGLQLRARWIVEGYVSGVHRSPFRGFSVEFAEHRKYAPGDDLRYLDWKVFARTDKFYLKRYQEETNLVCRLLVDVSESMRYRGPDAPMSKLEYAQSAAAALAYLILRQQDGVGAVTFDREIRGNIPPAANPSHLKEIIRVMQESESDRKTSLGPVFHELAERFKRRGIVMVLSDLFDDVDSLLTGLKHFRHRRHEVILFHVLDPAELDFPFEELTHFQGLEQRPDVLVEPRAVRRAYLREFDRYLHRIKQGCRNQRIDYVLMRTDRSPTLALSSYLASRMRRVRR